MKSFLFGITLILLGSLASPETAVSQEVSEPGGSPENSLGINIGLSDFHVKDAFLSPAVFSGTMFLSDLSYTLRAGSNLHSVEVSFTRGHPTSDIQPRDVTQYLGYVSYGFTHVVAGLDAWGHPLEISFGGGISTSLGNTDMYSVDTQANYVFADQSWYWSHAVNIEFRSDYMFSERRQLSARLSVPVVQLVSRPENGHYFNSSNIDVSRNFLNAAKQGRLKFPWNDVAAAAKLVYIQPVSESFNVLLTYDFRYFSADRPLGMGMYMNNFLAGIAWEF